MRYSASVPLRRLARSTGLILSLLVAWMSTNPVLAISAYARKYQTSCQTCHIAYPKLNAFGETFRLLGYRMPGETEEQVKQPDVPLGAPAYKRVWPNAVWPGGIPAHVPITISSEFLVQNSSLLEEEDGETERESVHNDFLFPSEVELILGGTAGEHVSFFGEIEFEREIEDGVVEQEVEVGHLDMRFIRPFANSVAFNTKIGSFQPEIVNTFDHARRLTIANYDSMFGVNTISPGGAESVGGEGHHGGIGVSLPAVARGVEFYGILGHRFFWTAGGVNGIEPGNESLDGNSSKDGYVRFAYKWGGLALDGSNAGDYVASEKNWRETSFRLGAFAYAGNGEDILPELSHEGMTVFAEDRDFTRVGGDFNAFYRDLNVFGAYVRGKDDLRVFDSVAVDPNDPLSELEPGALDSDASGEFTYKAWFLETDAVLHYPWLHGCLRYETVDLPNDEDGESEDWERGTASLTGLIRANVKATLEYTWDLNESKTYWAWLRLGIVL